MRQARETPVQFASVFGDKYDNSAFGNKKNRSETDVFAWL